MGEFYRYPAGGEPRFGEATETRYGNSGDRFLESRYAREDRTFQPVDSRSGYQPADVHAGYQPVEARTAPQSGPKRRRDYDDLPPARGVYEPREREIGYAPHPVPERGYDDRSLPLGIWRDEPIGASDVYGGSAPFGMGSQSLSVAATGSQLGVLQSGPILHPEDNLLHPQGSRPHELGMNARLLNGAHSAEADGRGAMDILPADATSTLFVDGLPLDCTRREAAHIFRPFIGYKEVRLVQKEAKRTPGEKMVLCFVEFADPRCAAAALESLQGYCFDEYERNSGPLRLSFARNPGPRAPAPRPDGYRASATARRSDFHDDFGTRGGSRDALRP